MEEIKEITDWLAAEIDNLPFNEQIVIAAAFSEFAQKVKPIYAKHQLSDGTSTFLFKL